MLSFQLSTHTHTHSTPLCLIELSITEVFLVDERALHADWNTLWEDSFRFDKRSAPVGHGGLVGEDSANDAHPSSPSSDELD